MTLQMQYGRHALSYKPSDKANMSRHWDEEKVGEWLKRINCAQYIDLFKRKHCYISRLAPSTNTVQKITSMVKT